MQTLRKRHQKGAVILYILGFLAAILLVDLFTGHDSAVFAPVSQSPARPALCASSDSFSSSRIIQSPPVYRPTSTYSYRPMQRSQYDQSYTNFTNSMNDNSSFRYQKTLYNNYAKSYGNYRSQW